MNPFKKEAYDYTMRDLEASSGCPQCRAQQLFDAVCDFPDDYSKGQSRACLETLMYNHEYGSKRSRD